MNGRRGRCAGGEWEEEWQLCRRVQRRQWRRRRGGVSGGPSRDTDRMAYALSCDRMLLWPRKATPARRHQAHLRPRLPDALHSTPIPSPVPARTRWAASRGRPSTRAGRAAASAAARPRPPACRATPFADARQDVISGSQGHSRRGGSAAHPPRQAAAGGGGGRQQRRQAIPLPTLRHPFNVSASCQVRELL